MYRLTREQEELIKNKGMTNRMKAERGSLYKKGQKGKRGDIFQPQKKRGRPGKRERV